MARLRLIVQIGLALALLALPAAASAGANAQAGKQVQVNVVDSAFEPKTVTINAGDTVVWTNNGRLNHTVTASDGSWDSGRLEPGKTFSHTFETAGTVPYYCRPHGTPDGQGMAATVMVQAAAAGAAQPPAASPQAAAQSTPAPSGPAPSGANSIDVGDQPLVGGSITVPMVMASADGWLVVHTNTPNNAPGPVIGQTAVKAGENRDVRVMLSQTPNAGDKLWPMLHIDAPQAGVYEFPGVDAPVSENGKVVMKQITVLPAGSAQPSGEAPRALPRTGETGPSNLWLAPLAITAVLLLGGAILLAANATDRR